MKDEKLKDIKNMYELMTCKLGDCNNCHIGDTCNLLSDEYGIAICNLPPDFWDDPQRYKFRYQVSKAYDNLKRVTESNIRTGYCVSCPLFKECSKAESVIGDLCNLDI